ncbi:hypothetical protein OOU_Y34scaffold00334g12 [Pyricularia oryzae Y34]|uniref:YDG domain-containing protein n=2 Tax=Pyricularia oryzae TaxID=318829 RepID=A0AA97P349_PYRO3|nr:hypothetical protein OOU_Y34scaffold00334g12 [Pyricularia oryzae Y34]
MASENERTADQASPRKRPTIASQNRVSKHTSAGRKIDQLCLPNKALVSEDFITDTPTNLSLETTPTSQEAGAGMQQTERQSTLAGHVEISPTMTADCSDTHTNDAQSWEHWDDIVAFAPGQDDSAVTTFIYNMLPKCKHHIVGNSSQAGELPKISYPPRDHPIYGVGGIMYGVLAGKPSSGARFRYTIDPRLAKKNAQIVGHNGLVPGDWFPKQLVALFKGAHGASQGGIAGSKGQGAVSIIVGSAAYESVDKDCGNVIYYSGAQKLGARLPGDKSDSASTKLLLESFSKGNLVRVIRKKNHISQHAPAEGLRYDGLYRITTWVERFEITTGRHRVLLFTLVRDPGQLSLDDAKARAPSATEQRRIVEAVEKGY